MRIAYVTDTPRMGGAERVLIDLAGAASAAGHDVTVLAPQPWLLEAMPVRTQPLPGASYRVQPRLSQRVARLLAAFPRMVRALRGFDVVHVSNGGHPGSALCCLALPAARAAGVPRRILTVHAGPRPRGEALPWAQAALDRLVWASADTVVGATRFVESQLMAERGLPAGKYVQVPYSAPEPGADPAASAALRREWGDGLIVGMVSATSDEQKGHHVLAEALAQAPGVIAVVVGAPPPEAAVARARALGVEDRFVRAGRLDDLQAAYAAFDVLVVPSVRDESLPLVVLEAMAASRPVFASRLSGLPEAVQDGVTGRLFAPGDAAALAALLREARDLGALGAAGRRVWAERYAPGAVTRAALAVYE